MFDLIELGLICTFNLAWVYWGNTSENLGLWVKERLGQIWGWFEGESVVRINVLGQEGSMRAYLVLFKGVLGCRIKVPRE